MLLSCGWRKVKVGGGRWVKVGGERWVKVVEVGEGGG